MEQIVPEYQPDLIIIGYCTNDVCIGMDGGLWWHFFKGPSRIVSLIQLIMIHNKYKNLPYHSVNEAYMRISKYTKSRNLNTIVCFFPSVKDDGSLFLNPGIEEFTKQLGMYTVDLTPYYSKHKVSEIYQDGLHPNKEGHKIAAEILCNFIINNQLHIKRNHTVPNVANELGEK